MSIELNLDTFEIYTKVGGYVVSTNKIEIKKVEINLTKREKRK